MRVESSPLWREVTSDKPWYRAVDFVWYNRQAGARKERSYRQQKGPVENRPGILVCLQGAKGAMRNRWRRNLPPLISDIREMNSSCL